MLLGEVAPAASGPGLYGMLVLAVLTVFVAGLMVGRTPEYLGKKLGAREMKLVAALPAHVPFARARRHGRSPWRHPARGPRCSTPARTGSPRCSTPSRRPATTTARPSPGSSANTPFFNTALGLAMLLGRFLPIVLVLALAGRLARQRGCRPTAGTLPTHRPLFVGPPHRA